MLFHDPAALSFVTFMVSSVMVFSTFSSFRCLRGLPQSLRAACDALAGQRADADDFDRLALAAGGSQLVFLCSFP
jgi:hypothetical protein